VRSILDLNSTYEPMPVWDDTRRRAHVRWRTQTASIEPEDTIKSEGLTLKLSTKCARAYTFAVRVMRDRRRNPRVPI
jgi:hypothetical protein